MRIPYAFLLSLVALTPAAAGAGVELTLAGGYRSGEAAFPIEARTSLTLNCVTTPCILAEARTGAGEARASLIVDAPISPRWMVEGLLTRQDGDLELRSSIPVGTLARETFESTTAQVGLLRQWGEGRFRPFAAGLVGGTSFESTALAYERPFFPGIGAAPVDEDVLSWSLATGLKAGLGKRVALRLEGRVHSHELSQRLGGTLRQTEAGAGLTYRF